MINVDSLDSIKKVEKKEKSGFSVGSILDYARVNKEAIQASGKEVNLSNIGEQISEDFTKGLDLAYDKNEIKNGDSPFFAVLEQNKELIKKVNTRAEEFKEIENLQKKPIPEMSQEEIQKITQYYNPDNQLTKFEELQFKNIVDLNNKYSEKSKKVLGTKSDNFITAIGETVGDPMARGIDENQENDTIVSRSFASIGQAGDVVQKNFKSGLNDSIKFLEENDNIYDGLKNKGKDYIKEIIRKNVEYDKQIAEIKKLDLGIIDKNLKFADIEYKRFVDLFPAGHYVDKVAEHAAAGGKKFASAFTIDEDLTVNQRMSRYWAGLIEMPMSVVTAVFDKEVTGGTGESAGAVMTAAFEPVLATISSVTQSVGSDRETADNWAFAVTAGLPFIGKGRAKGKVLTEETKFFNSIKDKNYQKKYIELKKMSNDIYKMEVEFENRGYYKNGYEPIKEAKDTLKNIQEAFKNNDTTKIKFLETSLQDIYYSIKKEKRSLQKYKVGKIFEKAADTIGAKQNLLAPEIFKDTGLKVRENINYVNKISDFLETDGLNKIEEILTKTKKQFRDQKKHLNLKKQKELKEHIIDKYIDDLGIEVFGEYRKSLKENIYNLLEDKKGSILEKSKKLREYQKEKNEYVDEVAEILGESKKDIIQDFGLKDTVDHLVKGNDIVFLEKNNVLEISGIKGDLVSFRVKKGAEWAFNGRTGNLYHYPKYLYDTAKSKAYSKELGARLKKAEEFGC